MGWYVFIIIIFLVETVETVEYEPPDSDAEEPEEEAEDEDESETGLWWKNICIFWAVSLRTDKRKLIVHMSFGRNHQFASIC